VVLGGQDEQPDAGLVQHARPLPGVKIRRIELLGIFLAVAPFAVGEGVHAKVRKGDDLVALPGKLLGGGDRLRGGGRRGRWQQACCAKQEEKE
jgi:hypothetical protein